MALIFIMSHQPGGELESYMPFFLRWFPAMKDFNWGHFVAYFILACTLYWGFGSRLAHLRGKVLVVLLCVGYGITDEIHQLFVQDRTADWIDVRNDMIGAAVAMLLLSIPWLHHLFFSLRNSIIYKGPASRN
jgi:VanZ family protein